MDNNDKQIKLNYTREVAQLNLAELQVASFADQQAQDTSFTKLSKKEPANRHDRSCQLAQL